MFKKRKNNGILIVFEGGDCTGKTTCANGLFEALKTKYEVYYSKGIGSKMLLGRLARKYPSTFLFCLELAFVTLFKIEPNLKRGKIILQDRYNQTIASHVPSIDKKINQLLIKAFNPIFKKPDLIVYFTVSPEQQIARLKKTMESNKYHKALVENPELIRLREEKYRELLSTHQNRLIHMDTSNTDVKKEVSCLAALINNFTEKKHVQKSEPKT